MSNLLVRLLGFSATVLHGDTLVLDRWLWLRKRLPKTNRPGVFTLIDVGCGSGAFTIGTALAGYRSLGLSWDARNQSVAAERALICGAHLARFEITDIRDLASRSDCFEKYDVAICCETIEHILDDHKLIVAITRCLMPGGRLFLTTPSINFRPITKQDRGPWSEVEDGGHVRKGYSEAMLQALCQQAGLQIVEVSTCSGYTSQKVTAVLRLACRIHSLFGWLLVLPLRILPPFVDPVIRKIANWPDFCICVCAVKPRH